MSARSNRGRHVRRATALAIALALVAGACSDDGDPASSSTSSSTSTTAPDGSSATDPGGSGPGTSPALFSGIRLSKGVARAAAATPTPLVEGSPLDAASIQAVLDRLPAWIGADTDSQPFRFPAATIQPPQPGQTFDVPFPAPEQPTVPEVVSGPLHVLRFQPEGAVEVAPFVSITFDQPMVPVATVGQLAAADVPATITPQLAGHWQWIGTSTLRFDAESDRADRLPMATDYTVTVPAGTASASGGVLTDAVSWQFSTPPVTVQYLSPTDGPLPLTPVFVATFDQLVDPAAVLSTVHVTADGDGRAMRLATADEIAADTSAQQIVDTAGDDRWLAFRPVDPLPADAELSISIGPDTPSAEGPRVTTAAASYAASTYPPLEVTKVDCGFGGGCTPGSEFDITFSTSLDTTLFDPATISVEPAIPGVSVGAYSDVLVIRGATSADTDYTVTLPAGLTDVFGQTLGQDVTKSIRVGKAVPMLSPFAQPFITVDPTATTPAVSVRSIGHEDLRVRIYAADPSTWNDTLQQMYTVMNGDPNNSNGSVDPDWPLINDETMAVAGDPTVLGETPIDLSNALEAGLGHVIVVVEPTTAFAPNSNDYWNNRPTVAWVQATRIGLDAFTDSDELRVWATDLATGAPLPGIGLTLLGGSAALTTDGEGLARISLPGIPTGGLVATLGDDTAFLPAQYYGGSWQSYPVADQAQWYVIDDRGIYRPGETVSVTGWVRRLTSASDGQVTALGGSPAISFVARDTQGNELGRGDAIVTPIGGFQLTFDIPDGANLGFASVELDLSGASGIPYGQFQHTFQIEEFRRPEFEVTARADSEGPYVMGVPVTVAADANYYAGGPLGATPVDWQVTTSTASYAPPGWNEFSFGRWTPWWYATDSFAPSAAFDGPTDVCCFPPGGGESEIATYTGTTDAAGSNYLQIDVGDLGEDNAGLPVTVSAQATVTDVNRQALSSTTSVLVHPASLYVGLHGARTYVDKGDPLTIDVIVTDIDGNAVAGRELTVTATRSESVFENGGWVQRDVDPQTCTVTTTAEPVPCTFTTETGGTYTVRATVVDDGGHGSLSELTRWVSDAPSVPTRQITAQALTIVPDKATYAPGDSAELLVQAPFQNGTGLLVVARNGLRSTNTFELAEGSAVVQVPIADADVSGLDLTIEVAGTSPRLDDDGQPLPDAPAQPAYATGSLHLAISTASRTLTVTATPRDNSVAPGTTTSVDVAVTDAAGQPAAGSELAVIVVDEAVLALSGYRLDDPLATFYGQLPYQISSQFGRQSIVLVDPRSFLADGGATDRFDPDAPAATEAASADTVAPETTAAGSEAPQGAPFASAGDDSKSAAGSPIAVRTNFDALAVFAPGVVTDASGHATVEVSLPDNLTRYRVMVVAAAGAQQFGSAEANITARLPLMVRPASPRFLNFGDDFALPVVVQNQTDTPMDVDVVLETANLDPVAPIGQRVTVPANDRVEVRFAVSAAQAGTARFRVSATSGDAADSATTELPVYTPATAEAFATYGVIDDGAVLQPVAAPTDVIPQFGGLDISMSSTSLQALTDAVLYIQSYPYESTDAYASRILAIAALRDVLEAFAAPGLPSATDIDQAVQRDIERLVALQNDDGGFPFWSRAFGSEPYNSVQATHALVAAREAGYPVPADALDRALSYLGSIEQFIPAEYGHDSRDTISAYALNVRMLAGDRDSSKAENLYDSRRNDLRLDAIAWLWPVIGNDATSAEIARLFTNRAVDTAGAATFTTGVTDAENVTLASDRRTDGLILDALIRLQPQSDLIPKVVTGLLAGQQHGRWDNIQENSFILLALKRYFDTYESQTPDFVARVWLGEQYAGEQTFSGRSTHRNLVSVPTAQLIAAGSGGLTIQKDGVGRLYYRIGLRTAPSDLQLDPLDRGFVVARTYEAVDDPDDVVLDSAGVWHVKAGARVRVRLTLVAESQRAHVALVDPLPAGLEILNPALAVTGDVPADVSGVGGPVPYSVDDSCCGDWWWYGTWFDHQNLRDDRAEAFSAFLGAGTYDYSYVARATTPGTFVAPPPRAEEIYAPETFGRGGTDTVVVDG